MHTCKDKDVVRIDRRSPFGNPFKIGVHGTRKEVMAMYRRHFYVRMLTGDFEFVRKIQKLKGKKLGCWRTPLPCHGEIIIEYLERI